MAKRPLNLTRDQFALFLKDHESIKQFENLFSSVADPQLSGGSAGSIPYQASSGVTTFLPIGLFEQVLQVNATENAPEWVDSTGSGNVVRAIGPSLSAPNLGTPASGTLTNCAGLPISTGVSGLGAGVATFLATPSSNNLSAAVTDETGTGALVFGTDSALTNPTITNGRATGLDYVGFDNTPTLGTVNPGTIYWDDGNGTLALNLKGGNVNCFIGEQEYALVFNDTAATITKGQVVYISGAQGNRIAVKLAQADGDANSAHTIGFVAETIVSGGEGWVQISGPIYKLNTLGATQGETVYLSPTTPGAWTLTKPVAPDHSVILGFIERVSATVGSIFIKVDNGYELDELHNVKITSVANNNLLQYDSTGPFWKNVAPSSLSVGVSNNLAGGLLGSVPYQTAASSTTFLAIGAANRVLTSSGTAPQWSNSLSGLASIVSTGNITGTSLTIHPVLNGKIGSNTAWIGENSTATVAVGMYQAGSGFTNIANLNFVSSGSTVRSVISCTEESGGDAAYLSFSTRNAAAVVTERMRITSAGVINIPNLTASQAVFTDANDNLVSNAITGTGSVVMSTSPALVTPILGIPQSGNFSTGTFTWPTFNQNTTGSAGSVANAVTFNNSGSGDASGITFNGSSARTISYNTIGAQAAGTYVTSVTGTAPVVSSGGTTPAISMAAATSLVNGYLTNTDWSTFNGKQAVLVSGTNIKTVSGTSLLGAGDVGTIGAIYGGTGQSTYALGDTLYSSATNTLAKLAGNITATKQFLSQTGTGTVSAAPVWSVVSKSDIGLGNVENTALSTWAGSSNITTLGTVATGAWNATTISIAKGGTGATTAVDAFDALSPATTLGDLIYSNGTDNVRLPGNITISRRFLRQTGTGTVSAAPAWDALTDTDIPAALTGKTYNSLTLTAAATGFTVAGGTTSKTLTVSNTLTLAGTDGSTLNVGTGGTLGSAAYTASTAYAPAAGSASIVTVGTITSGTWTGSAIGISSGGTGATSKAAGYNALSPMTTIGDLEYHDGANGVRLAGNTAAAKRFLTQTGTGTVSAAPGWNAIVDGDIPSALTGKTYNGLTLTANATGFQIAGGTIAKTLVISNNLTFAGTDGSTLNIGGGGTLGSAAYTASTAYAPAAGSASVTTLGTVTTGTWNATAIGAAYGGTGQTTYAVGDLLYASGTTALSKLAGVATGNALISGGVGAAPSWGKIGLSTHVNGVLPIANGGTNVSATPTNGQLLIGNGSGYALANIAGTINQVSVTNSAGGITLSLPQNINSGATPSFAGMTITGNSLLGYGTGSGGAVTQITSRSTGVTLNKTNGAITLTSAAGSAAWQSFTVTNSTVSATDTIVICQKSGADLYLIHVTNVSAGSFEVTFATTGGTTTEQPVFNFAVIKAVIS